MFTKKPINTIIIIVLLILFGYFIYQMFGMNNTFEFNVELTSSCDNDSDKKMLAIVGTNKGKDVPAMHNPLILPDALWEGKVQFAQGIAEPILIKRNFLGKYKIKKLRTVISNPATVLNDYKRLGAEYKHILCKNEHDDDYHTRRHIVKVGSYSISILDTKTQEKFLGQDSFHLYYFETISSQALHFSDEMENLYNSMQQATPERKEFYYVYKTPQYNFNDGQGNNYNGVYTVKMITQNHPAH